MCIRAAPWKLKCYISAKLLFCFAMDCYSKELVGNCAFAPLPSAGWILNCSAVFHRLYIADSGVFPLVHVMYACTFGEGRTVFFSSDLRGNSEEMYFAAKWYPRCLYMAMVVLYYLSRISHLNNQIVNLLIHTLGCLIYNATYCARSSSRQK